MDSADLIQEEQVAYLLFWGYIDVGDGCWRPNVLVTSLRYW